MVGSGCVGPVRPRPHPVTDAALGTGRPILTQPNRRRAEGEGPPGSGKPKARRVSPRKELAVVTLGMVAAISGVGGLLAANPPSWATTAEPAAVSVEQTSAQEAEQREAEQAAQRASQEAARQKGAAREAAARAQTARKESEQAAQRNEAREAEADLSAAEQAEADRAAAEQYAAEQAAAQAAAQQAAAEQAALEQQAVYSAQPQGAAAAVSQGS